MVQFFQGLSTLPTVDFSFSDVDFSQGKLKLLWSYIQSNAVISRPTRRPPIDRFKTSVHISHAMCGGVTDGSCVFSVYSRHQEYSVSLPPQGGRDLRSCADPLIQVGIPCAPSSVTIGSPCKVPLVKRLHSSLLDSVGLLPWSSRSAFVLCCCMFSLTKWCKCKLTAKELAKTLDIPKAVWQTMAHSLLTETDCV